MSHQTGITSSAHLIDILKQAKSGIFRSLKIIINNEKLELADKTEINNTFEQDYDECISKHIKDLTCCYVLMRSDEKSNNGDFKWIMILYTPDKAQVKDKMLYAATKASFKTFFGDDLFSHEIHGIEVSDIDYNGYKKHVISTNAAPPLTHSEKQYAEIKKNEVHRSILDKAETLRGMCFPIDSDVLDAFGQLSSASTINYVELIVDSREEKITLGSAKKCTVTELSTFECKEPRYHLFKYQYDHENSQNSALVFIYTMPGYTCAIKDRMMYSSCKGPLIEMFETNYGTISKKMEEEDLSNITEKYLYDELHPPEVVERVTFSKPKRPGRR